MTSRPARLLALIASLGLLGGLLAASPVVADAKLPAWDGGINLYRDGVFTTQKSWLWCTAADVQIIRNIVEGDTDHTTSGQRQYFDWMRDHNKYSLPESAGVDPQGWTAGLRNFVDDGYRLVASKSFDAALHSAVTNLRLTNLPVAVTVAHGGHGWVLTGFTATADPLQTKDFSVTSVRVVGPLFGLQSKNGYDMRPNTKLTTAQFRKFFTPWHYDPKPMIWDGLYVSIQPIAAPPAPVITPKPITPPPPSAAPSPTLSPTARPTQTASAGAIALAESPAAGESAAANAPDAPTSAPGPPSAWLVVFLIMLVAAAAIGRYLVTRNRAGRRGGPGDA